jgi:3-oxoacyl-[acyl-carrier protein] reductase
LEFSGKIAIVTGGSRGIGRATALLLAELGAVVAINYIKGADAAEEVVGIIESTGGRAIAIQADVSDNSQAARMIDSVINEYGRLDVLVNNAGITRDGLIIRLGQNDWADVLNTNLGGAFNCTQAAAKKMMKQKQGVIVNVSSVVGVMGNAGQANYAAAKAGLIGLTKSVAKELASRNIRVNAVAPGFITTEMTGALDQELRDSIEKRIPLGRFGDAGEIAQAIAWLASDSAAYITGQTLIIDGGLLM